MGTRALLDLKIWCPWSGAKLGESQIKPHKVAVMRCSNGTLFAICTIHRTRVFAAEWTLIQEVYKNIRVLDITEKPLRKARRPLNGAQKSE